jgi:ribonuclease P/MRP protein subunit POP5
MFSFVAFWRLFSLLAVKYWNPATGLAIFRMSRAQLRLVWTSLTLLTQLNSRAVSIRVLHVGGTIRSCQRALIRYSKQVLLCIKQKELHSKDLDLRQMQKRLQKLTVNAAERVEKLE